MTWACDDEADKCYEFIQMDRDVFVSDSLPCLSDSDTVSCKKQDAKLLFISSPNIDQLSIFFN